MSKENNNNKTQTTSSFSFPITPAEDQELVKKCRCLPARLYVGDISDVLRIPTPKNAGDSPGSAEVLRISPGSVEDSGK